MVKLKSSLFKLWTNGIEDIIKKSIMKLCISDAVLRLESSFVRCTLVHVIIAPDCQNYAQTNNDLMKCNF
ncbi:hypothetical protein T4D_15087 [Trichinella pseudospiralis]|uniref:Uncharacterized protein n=1 Tax=Trichinella pseudospiralis TaxID=6337 RepID=A0A0V1FDA0_TRIPS|nr:hypothetical protein T4D_15087 [Trichinella pseudospiralis]